MKIKKYRIFEYKSKDRLFRIEEDFPNVGWYLKVFDENMNCISDHLQSDLDTIIEFGFEEYGVENIEWIEKL